jgi:hypothetical protein
MAVMSAASRDKGTPAADAAMLLVRLGLLVLLVGLPIAGLVSRSAIYALLPVGGVSILCGAVIGTPRHGLRRAREALATPLGAAMILVVAWAGLSLLWTPFPAQAGERFFKMIAPAMLAGVVASYLPDKTRPFDLYLLPFGVAATAVGALALVYLGHPSFRQAADFDETLLERTAITSIVLVWPALGALALRERWITAAGLAVLVAVVSVVDLSRVPLAAMGAGAFTFAVAMSAPSRTARALAILCAGAILLAPLSPFLLGVAFGAFGEVPAPISIWKDIVGAQWPRLLTGHGLDLTNTGRAVGFLPPDAPRSLLFSLWYDLGALGAVGLASVTALALTAAGRIASLLGPAMLAGLVAVLVIAFLGNAVGQIWWLTLLDCSAIGFALVGKALPRTQRPSALEISDNDEGAGTAADGEPLRLDSSHA